MTKTTCDKLWAEYKHQLALVHAGKGYASAVDAACAAYIKARNDFAAVVKAAAKGYV
jgi:hypothetical protein